MRKNENYDMVFDMKGTGPTQQKILLLLMTLGTLSLTRSSQTYFHALKLAHVAWRKINRRAIDRSIHSLYRSQLIDIRDLSDGTTQMILTQRGKRRALAFQYETMGIPKPSVWDKKWRVVLSDIPEKQKRARDVLRQKLVAMGFYELQKSVFVHPYPCAEEVDFLIENFRLWPHIRVMEATRIDNELHLKKIFKLV